MKVFDIKNNYQSIEGIVRILCNLRTRKMKKNSYLNAYKMYKISPKVQIPNMFCSNIKCLSNCILSGHLNQNQSTYPEILLGLSTSTSNLV